MKERIKIVKEFLALIGKKVSFKKVSELSDRLGVAANKEVVLRELLSKLYDLEDYMREEELEAVKLTLQDPKFKKELEKFVAAAVTPKKRMNDQKITRAELEGLGIPYYTEPIEEPEGLGKFKSEDIYKVITDKLIDKIKNFSWKDRKSNERWSKDGDRYLIAYNFDSKKPYSGINQLMLSTFFGDEPMRNPYFMTFKQIEKNKGKLIKGSKGEQVVYYTVLYSVDYPEQKLKFASYDQKKVLAYLRKNKSKLPKAPPNDLMKFKKVSEDSKLMAYADEFPKIKYYYVFNCSDVSDIDFNLNDFSLSGKVSSDPKNRDKNIESAEKIVNLYPKKAPTIKEDSDGASYLSSKDLLRMPMRKQFENIEVYYATLFHELIHSTGHKDRLKRKLGNKFGSKPYAFEELIAETGATFLSAEIGSLHRHIKQNAAYIKSWNRALVKELEEDTKFIFRAAAQAQKAADFILQRDAEGIPLYMKKQAKKKKPAAKKKVIKKVSTPKKKGAPDIKKPAEKKAKPSSKQLDLFDSLGIVPFSDLTKGLNKKSESFKIGGPLKELLGNIEIKPVESLAITLDSPHGGGKTRFAFQAVDEFAKNGYKVLFVSLEEHRSSDLFKLKRDEYLTPKAIANSRAVSDLPEGFETIRKAVPHFDFIVIDSWNKLKKKNRSLDFDYDLRKAFDGKLFLSIFQRTSDGKMRGGSEAGFDGDIVLKLNKGEKFSDNYIFAEKNRYQSKDINTIGYNIKSKKIISI